MEANIPRDRFPLFDGLTDPRIDRTKAHSLEAIVVITILAVICGADGWTQVAMFGHSKRKWLETFLDLSNGIPSHDTFGRVFSMLDPDELERFIVRWTAHLAKVTGGEKLEVFDTDCGRVAILICYDIEFPEMARIAARKGAQIIFCPYNTDERAGYLRVRHCAQARCVENHLYVVLAGCTGNLPFVPTSDIHYAQSAILTPADISFAREGVAAETTPNTEMLIMQDLDIELLRRHRYKGTTQNWRDRRKDLYELRYKEDGQERVV